MSSSQSKSDSFSLIKAIEAGNISEAGGVLGKLAKGIKSAFGKGEPEKDTKADEPEKSSRDEKSSGISRLSTIVSEVIAPTEGEVRLVIFLPLSYLTSQYLKSGGGSGVIDAIKEPAEIQELVLDPSSGKSRIVQLPKGFTFNSLLTIPKDCPTKSNADMAVLLDVPAKLMSDLAAGQDLDEAKSVLKKIMSHKYYVLTLNMAKAKKIAPAMRAAKDLESRRQAFNPTVIENYPVKQDLVAAINEWNEEFTNDSDSRDEEDSKEVAPSVTPATPSSSQIQAPTAAKGDLKSSIISAIIDIADAQEESGSKFNPSGAANGLRIRLKGKNKDKVEKILRGLATSLGSTRFAEVADSVKADNSWEE